MAYHLKYSGNEFDVLLNSINNCTIINNTFFYKSSSKFNKINLNNMLTCGNYYIKYCTNSPINTNTILHVAQNDNQIIQIVTDNQKYYKRTFENNEFTDWEYLVGNIYIGDDLSNTSLPQIFISTYGNSPPRIKILNSKSNEYNELFVSNYLANDIAPAAIYDSKSIYSDILGTITEYRNENKYKNSHSYITNHVKTFASISSATTTNAKKLSLSVLKTAKTINVDNCPNVDIDNIEYGFCGYYQSCYSKKHNIYVMSGVGFGSSAILFSKDGLTWYEAVFTDESYNWRFLYLCSVMYCEEKDIFVCLGGPSGNAAWSEDGIHWTIVTTGELFEHNWTQVIYGNGYFIAFEDPAHTWQTMGLVDGVNNIGIIYSEDGKNWITHNYITYASLDEVKENINSTPLFTKVVYGNGIYVGIRGYLCSSMWVEEEDGIPNVKYDESTFYGIDKWCAVSYAALPINISDWEFFGNEWLYNDLKYINPDTGEYDNSADKYLHDIIFYKNTFIITSAFTYSTDKARDCDVCGFGSEDGYEWAWIMDYNTTLRSRAVSLGYLTILDDELYSYGGYQRVYKLNRYEEYYDAGDCTVYNWDWEWDLEFTSANASNIFKYSNAIDVMEGNSLVIVCSKRNRLPSYFYLFGDDSSSLSIKGTIGHPSPVTQPTVLPLSIEELNYYNTIYPDDYIKFCDNIMLSNINYVYTEVIPEYESSRDMVLENIYGISLNDEYFTNTMKISKIIYNKNLSNTSNDLIFYIGNIKYTGIDTHKYNYTNFTCGHSIFLIQIFVQIDGNPNDLYIAFNSSYNGIDWVLYITDIKIKGEYDGSGNLINLPEINIYNDGIYFKFVLNEYVYSSIYGLDWDATLFDISNKVGSNASNYMHPIEYEYLKYYFNNTNDYNSLNSNFIIHETDQINTFEIIDTCGTNDITNNTRGINIMRPRPTTHIALIRYSINNYTGYGYIILTNISTNTYSYYTHNNWEYRDFFPEVDGSWGNYKCNKCAYINNNFIVICEDGKIIYSTNAQEWSEPSENQLLDIVIKNNLNLKINNILYLNSVYIILVELMSDDNSYEYKMIYTNTLDKWFIKDLEHEFTTIVIDEYERMYGVTNNLDFYRIEISPLRLYESTKYRGMNLLSYNGSNYDSDDQYKITSNDHTSVLSLENADLLVQHFPNEVLNNTYNVWNPEDIVNNKYIFTDDFRLVYNQWMNPILYKRMNTHESIILYGNNIYIWAPYHTNEYFLYSYDLKTWYNSKLLINSTDNNINYGENAKELRTDVKNTWECGLFDGEKFIIANNHGQVAWSVNGIDWTVKHIFFEYIGLNENNELSSFYPSTIYPKHCAFGNGIYVFIGDYGGMSFKSKDGITWEYFEIRITEGLYDSMGNSSTTGLCPSNICFFNNKFIMKAYSVDLIYTESGEEIKDAIIYTTDFESYTIKTFNDTEIPEFYLVNNILMGRISSNQLAYSYNGENWETITYPYECLPYSPYFIYDGHDYIAIGCESESNNATKITILTSDKFMPYVDHSITDILDFSVDTKLIDNLKWYYNPSDKSLYRFISYSKCPLYSYGTNDTFGICNTYILITQYTRFTKLTNGDTIHFLDNPSTYFVIDADNISFETEDAVNKITIQGSSFNPYSAIAGDTNKIIFYPGHDRNATYYDLLNQSGLDMIIYDLNTDTWSLNSRYNIPGNYSDLHYNYNIEYIPNALIYKYYILLENLDYAISSDGISWHLRKTSRDYIQDNAERSIYDRNIKVLDTYKSRSFYQNSGRLCYQDNDLAVVGFHTCDNTDHPLIVYNTKVIYLNNGKSNKCVIHIADSLDLPNGIQYDIITFEEDYYYSLYNASDGVIIHIHDYNYNSYGFIHVTINDSNIEIGDLILLENNLHDILYSNNHYVAKNNGETNYILYSENFETWTEIPLQYTFASQIALYKDIGFMVFHTTGGETGYSYSMDGVNWVYTELPEFEHPYKKIISTTGVVEYASPTPDVNYDNIVDKPETLEDFGITNYYTKNQVDELLTPIDNSLKLAEDNLSIILDELNEITIPDNMSDSYETNYTRAIALNNKIDELLRSIGISDNDINEINRRSLKHTSQNTIEDSE